MPLDFQTISAIIFLILLSIFLYLKRNKLQTQGKFPFFYFLMHKTKFGLRFMDNCAKKFNKIFRFLGYFGIIIGFFGMIFLSFTLIQNIYLLFTKPDAVAGVGLVLPFQIKGVFFVPFFYWIISIFIIAIVHEYAHGVVARAYDLKLKSSGFAFLGVLIPIIPLAFVEPDEKTLRKRPHKQQLSVFAAGPFSNILLAFLLFLILIFTLFPAFVTLNEISGIRISEVEEASAAREAGVSKGETILIVNKQEIKTITNLSKSLEDFKPGDTVDLKTNKGDYSLRLKENPSNSSLPYMGVHLQYETRVKEQYQGYTVLNSILLWFIGNPFSHPAFLGGGLIGWLIVLNAGIGLFNLIPIGPVDGGRMLQLVLHRIFKKEKGDRIWYQVSMFFLFLVVVNIVFAFIR